MRKYTVLLSLILACPVSAQQVYEWHGPSRTGIYSETNLLKTWPEGGPAELWSIEGIGNGYGSPTFAGDNFFITGEKDSTCFLFCYDLKGNLKWKVSLGPEWMRSCPGSRSAPTIVGDMVYTGTGMGNLFCVNRKTGKIVWSKDFARDFEGIMPLHGHSEAPLIDGDKVFWTPGGKLHNVVALNRFTGKPVWSHKGFSERSAYNQPSLIRHTSGNILVTFSAYHLMGFNASTGQLLWSHEQDNYPLDKRTPGYGDTHCNSAIYENGSIWYVAGDGNCGVRLDLSSDGKTITEVWRQSGFDSYMGGVVRIGDFMYCGGTVKPELIAVNAATGDLTDSLRVGSGAIIAADNMIYYYTQKGEMMLVSFDKGNIEKVSSFKIAKGSKEHFAHPVINNGILYQRHGNVLMAFDIRKIK